MCGGTVAGGEGLSGHNEGRRIRTKVLEEVGKAIEENESICSGCRGSKLVVSETFGKE